MEKIAIIGIGCLFPGANTPQQFWENLLQQQDCTTTITEKQLGVAPEEYYHPKLGTADKTCNFVGGYINNFEFPDTSLDRIFHWCFYTAQQALQHGKANGNCGIIVGSPTFPTISSKHMYTSLYAQAITPYLQKLLKDENFNWQNTWETQNLSRYNIFPVSMSARLTAQQFDLTGPAYTIDAACSSSLYAIELASYHLLTGQADTMLAGAVSAPDYISISHGFNVLHALAENGATRPFDQTSQGVKLGEGAAFVLLKKYRKAVKDGDKVYAVIESIGLSNDGKGNHILSPASQGQILALSRAYQNSSKEIDYVECHATGTALGDQTELNTLEFFENPDLRIGGNKANIGHTLTVSGMASLIKVIMAMHHDTIPATIHIEKALCSKSDILQSRNIVTKSTAWSKNGRYKRAGINAFGFGGTNAHMILSESWPSRKSSEKPSPLETLSIVGMGACFGSISNLTELQQVIHEGTTICQKPNHRWRGLSEKSHPLFFDSTEGGYLEELELDCLEFNVAPNVVKMPLANHLLMAYVADQALKDAGIVRNSEPKNIAVIIAGEIDSINHRVSTRVDSCWQIRASIERCGIQLNQEQWQKLQQIVKDSIAESPYFESIIGSIGNLSASRISSLWNLNGPSFFLASQENSVAKALQIAQFLLSYTSVEAVVVGAVDLSGSWEHVAARRKFFAEETPERIGEGAGAIVVKRSCDNKKHRCYANVLSLAIHHKYSENSLDLSLCAETVAATCREALESAQVQPQQVDYIEGHLAVAKENPAEMSGLLQVYAKSSVVGSIKHNIGHTFAASGIASIIKTALCLYHKYIPNTGDFIQSPFAHAAKSRSWKIRRGGKRIAAVNSIGLDGGYSHILLQEPTRRNKISVGTNAKKTKTLLVKLQNYAPPFSEILQHDLQTAMFENNVAVEVPQTLIKENIEEETPQILITKQHFTQLAQEIIQGCAQRQLKRNAVTQDLYTLLKQKLQNKLQESLLPNETEQILWNREDILEIVEGQLANVLGESFAEIDRYPNRIRTPSPPFMFVSRVKTITTSALRLQGCQITWEYDIPEDPWYAVAGEIPATIVLESSHAILLALIYMGADHIAKGELRYRALDHQVKFYNDLPMPGQILEGCVNITKFIENRQNLLIFFEYQCSVAGNKILTMQASSGLFHLKESSHNQNLRLQSEIVFEKPQRKSFTAPRHCERTSFSREQLEYLERGLLSQCFGQNYRDVLRNCLLSAPPMQMLDRVASVDPHAGIWGLGKIVAEKNITPEHWAFQAHFRHDPVFPGALMIEGCKQTLIFYSYYLGIIGDEPFYLSFVDDLATTIKFRGEIKPQNTTLQFCLQIKSIQQDYNARIIICAAEILHSHRVIALCNNLAIRFQKR